MKRSGKYLWVTDYRNPKSDVFMYGKIVKETKNKILLNPEKPTKKEQDIINEALGRKAYYGLFKYKSVGRDIFERRKKEQTMGTVEIFYNHGFCI